MLTLVLFLALITMFVLYRAGIVSFSDNTIASLNFGNPNGGVVHQGTLLQDNDTALSRAYILIEPMASSKNLTVVRKYLTKYDSARSSKSSYKVDSIQTVSFDSNTKYFLRSGLDSTLQKNKK